MLRLRSGRLPDGVDASNARVPTVPHRQALIVKGQLSDELLVFFGQPRLPQCRLAIGLDPGQLVRRDLTTPESPFQPGPADHAEDALCRPGLGDRTVGPPGTLGRKLV